MPQELTHTTDIDKLICREGSLAHPAFTPGDETKAFLHTQCRILCVGAGGLGCEILKNLALSGFRNIDVIDMDTIDVSNLNRQFLFRAEDVGKPKAEVAAAFILKRVKGVKVTAHYAKIQDKDDDFYRQFNLIILGLDSVDARWWMNCQICGLLDYDEEGNPSNIIPMIDGGTEGFKGHARVMIPGMSACFECTIDLFPKQVNFPLCTLAETPRTAAHCIEWAHLILWDRERSDEEMDADNPEHLTWIYENALKRAAEYDIPGVTYSLTQGVVKNIIPAIASTNAIVAAACTNEAFKLATLTSQQVNNYMMYMGAHGLYTHTFEAERREDCIICNRVPLSVDVPHTYSVSQLVTLLVEDEQFGKFKLRAPSFQSDSGVVYVRGALEALTKPNLEKLLSEFVPDGGNLHVTDPALPKTNPLRLIIRYKS